MNVITQIYMVLPPRLVEDYVSVELEIQPAEAAVCFSSVFSNAL